MADAREEVRDLLQLRAAQSREGGGAKGACRRRRARLTAVGDGRHGSGAIDRRRRDEVPSADLVAEVLGADGCPPSDVDRVRVRSLGGALRAAGGLTRVVLNVTQHVRDRREHMRSVHARAEEARAHRCEVCRSLGFAYLLVEVAHLALAVLHERRKAAELRRRLDERGGRAAQHVELGVDRALEGRRRFASPTPSAGGAGGQRRGERAQRALGVGDLLRGVRQRARIAIGPRQPLGGPGAHGGDTGMTSLSVIV